MPEYLARAMIVKDVTDSFFKNPFYYMNLGYGSFD